MKRAGVRWGRVKLPCQICGEPTWISYPIYEGVAFRTRLECEPCWDARAVRNRATVATAALGVLVLLLVLALLSFGGGGWSE